VPAVLGLLIRNSGAYSTVQYSAVQYPGSSTSFSSGVGCAGGACGAGGAGPPDPQLGRGGGGAQVQMSSLQPEIVENRKGLAVAFNITGAVRGRRRTARGPHSLWM